MVWHHRGPRLLRTRGSARLRIARRTTWTVLVGSLVGFAVLVGSPMDDGLRLLRDLILYNLVHLAAACLCWWPSAATRSSVRAWRLLAVATVFTTAGNVCATLTPDAPGLLTPTLSDELHLAFYPVASIAVVLLAYDHRRRPVPAGWLDGLMVGLASAAVAAALVLAPMLRRDPSTSAQAITHLAYPVADLTLLIVLIVLGTVGGVTRPRVDPRLALLAAGAGPAPGHRPHLPPARPGRARPGRRTRRPRLAVGPVAVLATAACHRDTTRHPDRDTPAEPDGSTTPGTDAVRTRRPRRPGGRMPHHPPPGRRRTRRRLSAHRPAPHRADPPPTAGPARSAPGGAHRPADRPGQPTPSPGALHRPARSTRRRAGQPADDRPRRLQDRQRPPRPPRRRPRPRPGRRPPRRGHPRPGPARTPRRRRVRRPPTQHHTRARPSSSPNGCRPSWPHRSPSHGHQIHVGASIGISTAARPGSTATSLFHAADTAMYRAKNTHTGTDGRRDHRERRQLHPPRHPRQELHTVLIPGARLPRIPAEPDTHDVERRAETTRTCNDLPHRGHRHTT